MSAVSAVMCASLLDSRYLYRSRDYLLGNSIFNIFSLTRFLPFSLSLLQQLMPFEKLRLRFSFTRTASERSRLFSKLLEVNYLEDPLTKCIRKKLTPPQLTWIKSHPEKRKRLGDFEDGDSGIYFADRVAGKEYTTTEFEGHCLLNTTIIDGVISYLEDLFLADRFMICHLDTPTSACLRRIEDVVQTVRVVTYKRKRDVMRSSRPAIWEVVPHKWAASMYDLGASATLLCRATYVRLLWDKSMHGGNLGENPLFTDDTLCPLCGG